MGNKDDDPSRKVVNPHDARAFANQMGIDLFETSAKENKNVEEVSFLDKRSFTDSFPVSLHTAV